MTREEKIELLNRLLEIEEKNDIGNLTRVERGEFQQWVNALKQEPNEDATLKDIFCMGCEYKEQEPCEDAISRKAVLNLIDQQFPMLTGFKLPINALPSVNPQPKTGHWISHYDEDAKVGWYECDRCHTERAFNNNYCPDCGAKMG